MTKAEVTALVIASIAFIVLLFVGMIASIVEDLHRRRRRRR